MTEQPNELFYLAPVVDAYLDIGLEIVRVLARPETLTRPHVTVRGPYTEPHPKESSWARELGARVELGEVGWWERTTAGGRAFTLYLAVRSEALDRLLHKKNPHYQTLHLTLYDGDSYAMAEALYRQLKSRPLAATYTADYLERLDKSRPRWPRRLYLQPGYATPYTGEAVNWKELQRYPLHERRDLAVAALDHLAQRYPGP